jgi:subtilisin
MPIRVLLVVGSCLLALIPWTGPLPPADSAIIAVSAVVRDAIAREGWARVIVQLRLPGGGHVPEGRLSSASAAIQRSDIAAAQARVLARLSSTNHRLLHRYASVPLMALQIDGRGLTELEAAPMYVHRVVEDRVNRPSLAESVSLIGGDVAWARGFDGTDTVVAILDTGVESTHPFLAGKVVEEACYSSTVSKHSRTLCPNGRDEQIGPGAAAPCSLDTAPTSQA